MEGTNRHLYVVDDDVEVRKSLHFLLSTVDIRTWPFLGGQDFVDQLVDLRPAPVLLDIRMPGMDGFDVLREMELRDLDWPVIVMTAHGDVPVAVRAMKQGAIEFLEKPFSAPDLEAAVARGFSLLEAGQERREKQDAARQRLSSLTAREREVVIELARGAPNKVVAHRLDLSIRTVEMHRSSAMSKLGVKSLVEAATLLSAADALPPNFST